MRVIEVIPISRGIAKDTLSYFTAEDVLPGALVQVPLRSKIISALVVHTQDAVEAKIALKTASFAIRKVEKLQAKQFLYPEFMDSVQELARFSAATAGSVLSAVLPKEILEHTEKFEHLSTLPAGTPSVYEPSVLQAGYDDRIGQYKSLIREYFAKKQSVFVCVPTIQDARTLYQSLCKGIENYTVVIHGGLPKKKLPEEWAKIVTSPHPLLIIGTSKLLCLPRPDIRLLIIEKENARGYKTIARPYVDVRTFAEFFAKRRKIKIVYGDTLLRIETLYRHDQGEYQETISPSYRLRLQQTKESVVDMKPYSPSHGRPFQTMSDELEALIKKSQTTGEHICIFTVRRGLAPITVCGDCGTIVYCNKCQAPTSLHSHGTGEHKQYFFLCHRCGERRDATERCKHCDSWKLVMLGIGIQGVEKEIIEKFPEAKIFRIDSDTTPTDKKIRATLEAYRETKGAILLGTEMMLAYLEKIDHVAVVSIDALFSLPDFRIHERLLYTLLNLRHIAEKTFLIQTRAVEEKVFEYALKTNIIDFYREEIKERKQFNYPPFSILIKITLHGSQTSVQKEMDHIKTFLEPYELSLFPAFIKSAQGYFIMHGLIKLPRKQWVDEVLLQKLRALPPHCTVAIDPESLL